MPNMQIFDKDGNKLNIADVIYSFMKDKADLHSKNIDDVFITTYRFGGIFIETYEETDFNEGGISMLPFGERLQVNI